MKFFKLDTQIKKTCTLILKSVYISRIFNLVLEVSIKFFERITKKRKRKRNERVEANDNLTRQNEQRRSKVDGRQWTRRNKNNQNSRLLLKVANCTLVCKNISLYRSSRSHNITPEEQIRFSKPSLVALTNDTFTLLL